MSLERRFEGSAEERGGLDFSRRLDRIVHAARIVHSHYMSLYET